MSTNHDDDDVSSDLGGAFLRQSDFETLSEQSFTISRVEKVLFEASGGRPAESKWVLTFSDERRLGLNKTNLTLLARWFGKKPSAWNRERIIVYRDESVSFGGRLVGGLRVRRPSVPPTATDRSVDALTPKGGDDDIPF